LRWFENATFKEEESIEDFTMRLSGMVHQLATLDERVEEPKVAGKFLRSVPHCYWQIVIEIQSLLDVDTLTLANVTGHLKAAVEEFKVPPPSMNHASKLYLLEEAWEEKWKERDGKKATGGGRGGGQHGGRSNRGCGNGGCHNSGGSSSNGSEKLGKDQCKHCFKFGHWGRGCKNRPKREATNVAQEEEDALLIIQASIESSPNSVVAGDGERASTARQIRRLVSSSESVVKRRKEPLHLHEEKVFVRLREKEDRDTKS
jgi:hypothetical protein